MSARRSWIRWGGVGAGLCALSLLSCKEAVMEPLSVAAVEVAGGGVNLRLGQTAQLTPTLKSAKGYVLPKVGISWSSSDGAKASISPSGQVTAVSRGPVTLTATAGGVNGTAAVTVIGVQSIALAPETLSVIVTQTRAMTATTVLDPGVTVTPTWRSLDTTIARVGTDGRVTATSTTGIARIEVTAEDKKDTAVVRVVPVPVVSVVVSPDTATRTVGQTLQLTATPRDSIGGALTGRTVAWSSSDTAKATVSSSGLVTAKAVGTATITATAEGKTGSAALTVVPVVATVASVTVTPATATLFIGATQQLTATLKDSAGGTLTGRTVAWSSSNTAIATVSTSGLVSGVAIGSATITAISEGKTASAAIIITQPSVSDGLVAYYPLNGNAQSTVSSTQEGTLFSSSWNRDRKGTATGAATFVGGTSVRVPGSVLNNLPTGSFSMWIRWDSVTTYQVILAKVIGSNAATYYFTLNGCNDSNGFITGGAEPGQICWHPQNYTANPAYVASTGKLVRGLWNHVAVTWTSSSISLYLNGSLDKTVSCTGCGILNNSTVGTTIGRWSPTENLGDLRGAVDEFRIYNRVLSLSEVASLASDNRPLVFNSPISTSGDPGSSDVAVSTIFKVMPNRGTHERIIATGQNDIMAALSPSGDSVAFSSNRHGGAWYELEVYVASITGTGLRRITNGYWSAYGKSWSPSGDNLTFESQGGTALPENLRIYTVPRSGGSPNRITNQPRGRFPDWSPDGSRILYYLWPSGINSVRTDGTDLKVLRNVTTDALPRWSPDGSKIAFAEGNNIWTMNADGSGAQAIVTLSSNEAFPEWSPDGSRIAFLSDRSGVWQIWSVLADGAELVQITNVSGGLRRADPFSWR